MRAQRLLDGPIISAGLHPSIGVNIQGPSMIRTPDWIERRLSDYCLYFADHKGRYIRLAYADNLLGPWRIHPPGSLQLEESCFLTERPKATPEQVAQFEARLKQSGVVISHDLRSEITTPHIASPDAHVDQPGRRIVMYFHGLDGVGTQVTRVATSPNGIDFDMTYALACRDSSIARKTACTGPNQGRLCSTPHAAFRRYDARRRNYGSSGPRSARRPNEFR
jgi:hypothetical protein